MSSAEHGARAIALGSVPYLVGRPLDCGLEHEPGIAYRQAPPAELVAGLRSGALDLALVSSIELFRRPGYSYLADLAVGARGRMNSVQLFLERPLAEVESVALDPDSRASVALLRIELAARLGREPRYLELEPGAAPERAGCDAWLRIGDAALRAHLREPARPVLNLSQAWHERMRLPFPFALWIARPGFELERCATALRRARARGAAQTAELAREAAQRWQLPLEACRNYLERECVYELGAQLEPALLAFGAQAAALGLARADCAPRACA